MEKKTPSPEWERIEQIIAYSGERSVSAFARRIGLKRAENLYQIKRGKNGISKELAAKIVKAFPEFSKAWLLTGESITHSPLTNNYYDTGIGEPNPERVIEHRIKIIIGFQE